jgi:hypothetical protein
MRLAIRNMGTCPKQRYQPVDLRSVFIEDRSHAGEDKALRAVDKLRPPIDVMNDGTCNLNEAIRT